MQRRMTDLASWIDGISRSWGSTISSVDCSAWHRMLIGAPFLVGGTFRSSAFCVNSAAS